MRIVDPTEIPVTATEAREEDPRGIGAAPSGASGGNDPSRSSRRAFLKSGVAAAVSALLPG